MRAITSVEIRRKVAAALIAGVSVPREKL
jgi:hypothetical protein